MKVPVLIRRAIAAVLAILLLVPASLAAAAPDTAFRDVGEGHWAYEYIERAVAEGLFRGVPDGRFAPDDPMTRSMFVTVLDRMDGDVHEDRAESGFTDVSPESYYAGAVRWAAEAGIAKGTGDGTFTPDRAVTREEAATFLYRYALHEGLVLPEGESADFTDGGSVSDFAAEAVRVLSAAGILNGYADGSVRPLSPITRAEAAKLAVCFLDTATKPAGGGEDEQAPAPQGGTVPGGTADAPSGKEEYSVGFSASGAFVTVDGRKTDRVTVEKGESLTFAVTPEEGCRVDRVTGGARIADNGDGTYTVERVTGDLQIMILAKAAGEHEVRFNTAHASVLVDGKAVTSVTVPDGGDLTFTASSEASHEIVSVIASSGTPVRNPDGSYTVSDIRSDETVAVTAVTPDTPQRAYTVTFVAGDGVTVLVDGEPVQSGTAYSNRSYFEFVAKAEDDTRAVTGTASNGTLNSVGNTWVLTGVTGNTTVTLTSQPRDLRVRFVSGAGASGSESVTVKYGGAVSRPADPVQSGRTFGGWYTDTTYIDEFDFNSAVTENTTLYALWLDPAQEVHVSGIGSNRNDGATMDTAVYSMDVAIKLAKISASKTIVVDTDLGIFFGEEEAWDLTGLTVKAGRGMTSYNSMMFNVFGKLTITGGVFDGNGNRTANTGCSFLYVYNVEPGEYGNDTEQDVPGEVTLNGCEVKNFGSLPRGTDIYSMYSNCCIYVSGVLTVSGGKYHDNLGVNGAVFYVNAPSSKLTVSGGEFYDNEASYHEAPGCLGLGGVIYAANGVISVEDAQFRGNKAGRGGAIYFNIPGPADGDAGEEYDCGLTVTDCTFTGNSAVGSPASPGAVSADGGAIYAAGQSSRGAAPFKLKGSNSFSGNTAGNNGGAVYTGGNTYATGVITAENLILSGNTAQAAGDGIYIANDHCGFALSPTGSGTKIDDEVFLGGAAKLTVSSTLAGIAAPVRLGVEAVQMGRVVAEGTDAYTLGDGDLEKFSLADTAAALTLDRDNNAVFLSRSASGGGDIWAGDHDLGVVYLDGVNGADGADGKTPNTAFKTFARAKAALAKDGVIYVTGTVTVKSPETWSLDDDGYDFGTACVRRDRRFTEGSMVDVVSVLTLRGIALDGGSVTVTGTASQPGSPVSVEGGGQLILDKGSELRSFVLEGYYGIVYAKSGATVTVTGGKFTDNTNRSVTGSSLIYVSGVATLTVDGCTMEGNTLTGNTATAIYSAGTEPLTIRNAVIKGNSLSGLGNPSVVNASGPLEIAESTFEDNTVGTSGGVIYYSGTGTLTVTSCNFKGNRAAAVIDARNCDVTLTGGEISDNILSGMAPVRVKTAKLNNVKIIGNSGATGSAAVSASGDLTITGCNFEGNSSVGTSNCGVITISGGTLTIGDGSTIKDNTVAGLGGVICVTGTATVNVSGGEYTGNSAGMSGGVFYIAGTRNNTTLNITGGTFTGNKAGGNGGILAADALYSGKVTISGGTFRNNTADGDGNGIYVNGGLTVSIVPGELGLTLEDEIFLEKSKSVRLGDLTHLTDKLPISLAEPTAGATVATPADGHTLTDADAAKLKSAVGAMTFKLQDKNIVVGEMQGVTTATLDKTALELFPGQTATLTVTVEPNQRVTWESNSPNVEIVGSKTGKTITLEAKDVGQAEITATPAGGGEPVKCTVTVKENTTPVSEVKITASAEPQADGTVELIKGGTLELTATVLPELAADKSVEWTVEGGEEIVEISGDGNTVTVTGFGEGTVTVKANAANNVSGSITIQVKTYKVDKITVPDHIELEVGETYPLEAAVDPEYAEDKTLTWESEADGTAKVDAEDNSLRATVTGVAAGSTTITVTAAGGAEATISVTVKEAGVKSNAMTLDVQKLELIVHQRFTVSALFEDHAEDVTWSSSSDRVVKIVESENGQATIQALMAGTAVITAESGGQSLSFTVTVSGAKAGTSKDVYISGTGNDRNAGTPAAPVATVERAMALLAVDGTIHVTGAVYITRDTVLSLPSGVYGSARVVFEGGYFALNGPCTMYVSDVTLRNETSQFGFYAAANGAEVYMSTGVTFTGADNRMARADEGASLIINDGTYQDFTYTSSYGVITLRGGRLTINGGEFKSITGGAYGGLASANEPGSLIEMNGGAITGCGISTDKDHDEFYHYSGVFHVGRGDGKIVLRGGAITDCVGEYIAYVQEPEGLVLDPTGTLHLEGMIGCDGSLTSCPVLVQRQLDKLEGEITLFRERPAPGVALVAARDVRLSWSDVKRFQSANEGFKLDLDTFENQIVLVAE